MVGVCIDFSLPRLTLRALNVPVPLSWQSAAAHVLWFGWHQCGNI
jgi:hypothetical protein